MAYMNGPRVHRPKKFSKPLKTTTFLDSTAAGRDSMAQGVSVKGAIATAWKSSRAFQVETKLLCQNTVTGLELPTPTLTQAEFCEASASFYSSSALKSA